MGREKSQETQFERKLGQPSASEARRFSRIRLVAWALPLAILLLAASLGCELPETPEPPPTATPFRPNSTVSPTATSFRPSSTVAPTATPDPVRGTTPSGGGLVLQVSVAPVPADLPEYDRGEWRHWTDEDSDCQNARQEVLIAESTVAVTFQTSDECRVATGRWQGPYTGEVATDPGKLDIDHLVPLENAHRSGAWAWDRKRKREFANHIGYDNHLLATNSSANRSKGSKGPERWRPPLESYWCVYAIDWIAVKNDWGLTVTEAEFGALRQMLATCPMPALLQRSGEAPQPAAATPVPAATGTPAPTAAVETPAPRPTVPPGLKYDPFGPDRNCGDFDTYEEALEFYLAAGGPAQDPHNLDSNGDGKPCESLPRSRAIGQSAMVPASGSSAPVVPVSFSPMARQALPTPTVTPAPALLPTPAEVTAPAPTATPAPVRTPLPSPSPTSTLVSAAAPAPALMSSSSPEPVSAATPAVELSASPEFPSLPHDPDGPDRSCADFASWWEAQNFYYAAGGPGSDPHRLDGNGDGVACQSLQDMPVEVPESVQLSPETTPPEDVSGFVDRDCSDFDTWQEAQEFFISENGPGGDPHGLDKDGNGVACQSLPGRRENDLEPPLPGSETPTPEEGVFVDRNCGDFGTWQEAQGFFLSEGGPENDPHRLDRNGDGIACESLA
jgi:hypothetical protein